MVSSGPAQLTNLASYGVSPWSGLAVSGRVMPPGKARAEKRRSPALDDREWTWEREPPRRPVPYDTAVRGRYCRASARWAMLMPPDPSRSAIVRDTLRIR